MSDELQELQEHAEHARHNPDLAPVSLTMAILAVVVAAATLMGHRTHTEEIVLQNKVRISGRSTRPRTSAVIPIRRWPR